MSPGQGPQAPGLIGRTMPPLNKREKGTLIRLLEKPSHGLDSLSSYRQGEEKDPVPTITKPLELFKFLPRTNCRTCGVPTCLAFAAAVIKGQKILADCPLLAKTTIDQLAVQTEENISSIEQQMAKYREEFRSKVHLVDFAAAARRLGGTFTGGRLTIRCLGKGYTVDGDGNIASECHLNPWVVGPLLNYILHSPGRDASGEWISFHELGAGMIRESFYEQVGAKTLKAIADSDPLLFEYLLYVFGGRPVPAQAAADLSFVLHPLPKLPVNVRYSRWEDEAETTLNIVFDAAARDNLPVESIFGLVSGLGRMMEKIAARHCRQ